MTCKQVCVSFRPPPKHFAAHGARVAVLDFNEAQANAVAEELKGFAVATDVRDEAMNETCQHSPSSDEEASHECLQLDHLLSLELLALAAVLLLAPRL